MYGPNAVISVTFVDNRRFLRRCPLMRSISRYTFVCVYSYSTLLYRIYKYPSTRKPVNNSALPIKYESVKNAITTARAAITTSSAHSTGLRRRFTKYSLKLSMASPCFLCLVYCILGPFVGWIYFCACAFPAIGRKSSHAHKFTYNNCLQLLYHNPEGVMV